MKFNQVILLLASVSALRVKTSIETPADQAKEIFRQFDANVDEFVTRDEVNKGIDNVYETKMSERDQELASQKKLHQNALEEDFPKIAKIDLRDLTTLLTTKYNTKVAADKAIADEAARKAAEEEARLAAEEERLAAEEAEKLAAQEAALQAAQAAKEAAIQKAEEEREAKEEAARAKAAKIAKAKADAARIAKAKAEAARIAKAKAEAARIARAKAEAARIAKAKADAARIAKAKVEAARIAKAKAEAARKAIINSQVLVTKPITLIREYGHCDLKNNRVKQTRIAIHQGKNLQQCNALCLKTKDCKSFQTGYGRWNGRCDLYRNADCQWNAKAFTFDYWTPSQTNQVRQPTSHFSKENPKGCVSAIHPQNYLGIRRVGTQAQCTAACFKTKNCFSFNMHRGSHCHLYSQDYKCRPNSQQDKYYMNYKPALTR